MGVEKGLKPGVNCMLTWETCVRFSVFSRFPNRYSYWYRNEKTRRPEDHQHFCHFLIQFIISASYSSREKLNDARNWPTSRETSLWIFCYVSKLNVKQMFGQIATHVDSLRKCNCMCATQAWTHFSQQPCFCFMYFTPTAQVEDETTEKNRNSDRKIDEIITTRRLLFS
jgi:hypothetical protein